MSDKKISLLIKQITEITNAIAEGEATEAAALVNEFEEAWIEEPGISDLVENIDCIIGFIDCVIGDN